MFMSAYKSLTMCNIDFIAKFMAYLHTRFCMPSSRGSLHIAIKRKAKYTLILAVFVILFNLFLVYLKVLPVVKIAYLRVTD
jgi:hypothetical protein